MPLPVRRHAAILCSVLVALAFGGAACGSEKEPGATRSTTTELESGAGGEDAEANTLTIDMKEYSFAVTGALKAGTANIALTNSGSEMHMAGFLKLAQGKTQADLQTALQSQDQSALGSVVEKELGSPGSVLSPGQSEQTTTDAFDAGTYAIVCFIPTAGGGQPVPHFAKGMVTTFDVAAGAADLTMPEPDAEYTIEKGKNDGPVKLKAGENVIKATAGADGRHEFFVMRKKSNDTKIADVDKFFSNLFEGSTAPPAGYTDQAPAVVTASSFDLDPGKSVFLTVDLEPGHYLIGCALEPDATGSEKAQPHTGEVLDVEVT